MSNSDLINVISKISPIIATALGGPIGGILASIIGIAFNNKDISTLSHTIANDPEAAQKLKQIELDHALELEKINLQKANINFTDIQNARDLYKYVAQLGVRWFLPCLATLVTFGFIGTIALMFFHKFDEKETQILYILLGILGTAFSKVCQFYFG